MRRAADHAVPADVGAAGDADAAGDRRVRADAQLWPIWIWLSSLTPSSITVSSSAPRSMVVLAPISTSSPMRTRADLRDLDPAPAVVGDAEAVGADHRAGVHDARARRGCSRVDHHAADRGSCRRRSCTPSPTTQPGADRDALRRAVRALARSPREGCTPGACAHQRVEELRHAREVGVGIVGRRCAAARSALSASAAEDHRAGARRGELARGSLVLGEEGDLAARRRARARPTWLHQRVGVAGHPAAEARDDLARA